MKKNSLIGIGLMISALLFVNEVRAQTLSVDLDSTRQVIKGFGGIHINSWSGTELNEDLTEKAFGNDPGKIGLTILRLRIDPDSNLYYRELPIAQHAVDNGAIVFASPWNPPLDMLDPGSTPRRLLEDYYPDYADHLNQYYTYMNDNGVPLYAISVQNEPDWNGGWTQWTAAEMIKFLKENAQNIETRVIAPESSSFDRSLSDSILNDVDASANLDIMGGHIYGGGLYDYPLARNMGKEVWMTEHYTSSDRSANLWPDALLVGSEITDCMQANFNAYVWWYIRRWYGLITEDGLISKRGYVMSQFSKFVRPGATRVDATLEAASGVDAAAFKTDTSIVIVVVNSNNAEVSLDFTLQNNIGIDTLTQFTTSATKNVVNDGGITITGDAFSATLDAYSITTFTSYAEDGGKYNNVPPIANAGADITIEDEDGNGSETITLDGTASSDPDGTIQNYSWSINGNHGVWGSSVDVLLDIGEYEVVLTVTDVDGAIHSDTMQIAINSVYSSEIWFDAECGTVGSIWEINSNEAASNSEYVNTPGGTQSIDSASTDTAYHLIYTIQIEEAGPYKLWGRVITPSPDDDSYWVKMDDGDWILWNSIPSGTNWHWDDVHNSNNNSEVMVYDLDAGEHTLSICLREDGALLDKLFIANTGIIPTGVGEADTTCPDIPDAYNAIHNELTTIEVFPNPAQNEIQVSWKKGFSALRVVSMEGKTILHREFPDIRQYAQLSLDLEPGMYLLLLKNEKSSVVTKLLIE